MGLFRTSFLIAYSNASMAAPMPGARRLAAWGSAPGDSQRGPPRRRMRPTPPAAGNRRPFRESPNQRRGPPFERAERVLHDPILQRVKRDYDQPCAAAQAADGGFEKSIQALQLAI